MSVIGNLQTALDCAGKCDCCDKLQSQMNALGNKINWLEQKQKQCCDDKKPNTPPNTPVDLKEIYRRLAALEKSEEALKIGAVESLNNFADIENTNQELIQTFKSLYEMVTPLIDSVSSIITLLGDNSE